jgi:hypothetical protein
MVSGLTAALRNELQKTVAGNFTKMNNWLRQEVPDAGLGELPAIETPDDVVEATRVWCKGWQRYAQMTLYGGRGLNHAIGKLKMIH